MMDLRWWGGAAAPLVNVGGGARGGLANRGSLTGPPHRKFWMPESMPDCPSCPTGEKMPKQNKVQTKHRRMKRRRLRRRPVVFTLVGPGRGRAGRARPGKAGQAGQVLMLTTTNLYLLVESSRAESGPVARQSIPAPSPHPTIHLHATISNNLEQKAEYQHAGPELLAGARGVQEKTIVVSSSSSSLL
ncbi:unnamed protein product [Calypogeia fissa]